MMMDATAFVADRELIDALKKDAEPVDCGEERVLFNQGDLPHGLYIFCHGRMRLTMRSQVGEVLMDMQVMENSLLGLPGLVSGAPYGLTAIAEKGSEVGFVSQDVFARIMLSQPPIAVGILRVLAAEVRTARMALVAN
jgi:CRP-like cAMP-binding protein